MYVRTTRESFFYGRTGVRENCLLGVHNNGMIMGCVKNRLRLDNFFVAVNSAVPPCAVQCSDNVS